MAREPFSFVATRCELLAGGVEIVYGRDTGGEWTVELAIGKESLVMSVAEARALRMALGIVDAIGYHDPDTGEMRRGEGMP